MLGLANDMQSPARQAAWISNLILLGSRAAHWSRLNADRQLVVAVSVPVRDFAAALIGCGWMMASPAPVLPPVRDVALSLSVDTPVRAVTQSTVITENFRGVDLDRGRLNLGGYEWILDKVDALTPIPHPTTALRQPIIRPGVICQMAGMSSDWAARLCSPPEDFALIGTLSWLRENTNVFLARGSEREPISSILLPTHPDAATWSTRLYSALKLDDDLPLPESLQGVVLDGTTAAQYLAAIETKVVIAILDRSIADQTAGENVVQYYNSRGNPLSLKHDVRWTPTPGIEALGFWIPL